MGSAAPVEIPGPCVAPGRARIGGGEAGAVPPPAAVN